MRRVNTYEQVESGRGYGGWGNGQMSPYSDEVYNVLHSCYLLCSEMEGNVFARQVHKGTGMLSKIFDEYCEGITQTLIPDTLAVKPKASQSTDGNLLWSVVYISDTACLRAGAADDTQPALADPHPLRWPWPVTGGYAAGVP
jgi:hypothetical protein